MGDTELVEARAFQGIGVSLRADIGDFEMGDLDILRGIGVVASVIDVDAIEFLFRTMEIGNAEVLAHGKVPGLIASDKMGRMFFVSLDGEMIHAGDGPPTVVGPGFDDQGGVWFEQSESLRKLGVAGNRDCFSCERGEGEKKDEQTHGAG